MQTEPTSVVVGPTGYDSFVAGMVAGWVGFVVLLATIPFVDSSGHAVLGWIAGSVVLWLVILRRCGTVVDLDGVHHQGVRRRDSWAWSEVGAAYWGDVPARGDGNEPGLYLRSRSGGLMRLVGTSGTRLDAPRTWLGRRKVRRFVAVVRALQAREVPVVADTLELRSTMWAIGLEPDAR